MSTIMCSSCRQAKPDTDFSKSQRKKLAQNPNTSVVCETCKGNTSAASATPQISVLAQAAKSLAEETSKKVAAVDEVISNDPSLQYFKHPLRAPIVKTFQDFFRGHSPELYPGDKAPEVFYNKRKEGWRTASKLPVRSEIKTENGSTTYTSKIGLFSPGSHNVVESLSSPIHHPAINRALLVIKESMQRVGIYGYHESIGDDLAALERSKACIKYLMIAVQRHTDAVQVTFVTQSPRTSRVLNPLLHALVDDLVAATTRKESPVTFHSIWLNHHYASKHCNTVNGRDADDWRVLYSALDPEATIAMGKGSVIEYLDDYDATGALVASSSSSSSTTATVAEPPVAKVPLYFPPNVFRQANLGVFRNIVYDIRHWLRDTQQVHRLEALECLELYGGVGTIGLHCLDLVRRLVCSDENPNNEACFYRSLAMMRQDPALVELVRRVTYLTGKSSDLAQRGLIHQQFDVLIVDPPRKGLEPEVMEQLLLKPGTTSQSSANEAQQVATATSTTGNDRKRKIPAQPMNKKMVFVDSDEANDGPVAVASTSSSSSLGSSARTLKRLIYVSCGFEAFQRDCAMLTGDESIRNLYTVSQTTSYPTIVSSARVPGMTGTVHTHYHHDTQHKNKKRKTSATTAVADEAKHAAAAAALATVMGTDDAVEATTPVREKQGGLWKLVYAKGYLMFPGANHIETLAIFDRVDA